MNKIIQVGNLVDSSDGFSNPQRGRVYSPEGIAPTVDCKSGGRELKVFLGYGRSRDKKGEVVSRHFNPYTNALHAQVGHARDNMEVLVAEFDMNKIKIEGSISSSQNARVVSTEGISPAVTNGEKDGMPKIIERDTPMKGNYKEPRICTMVGRDPNNPSSRARSEHYEQMIELGGNISNTLTSVQKDNLIAEPKIIQNGHGFNKGGEHDIAPTLTSSKYQDNNFVKEQPYRIRRLTPRETFRLMDVSDRDIDKIQQAGISNTQQYKMAGNSIVVSCLERIFESLFINGDTAPTDHNGQYILF